MRIIVWFVLAAPLVLYVLIFPVKTRLDRGVIERRSGGSVWITMSRELPEVEAGLLMSGMFWLAAVGVLAGSLALIWFALDPGDGPAEIPSSMSLEPATDPGDEQLRIPES
jgi:hypothetical protein